MDCPVQHKQCPHRYSVSVSSSEAREDLIDSPARKLTIVAQTTCFLTLCFLMLLTFLSFNSHKGADNDETGDKRNTFKLM